MFRGALARVRGVVRQSGVDGDDVDREGWAIAWFGWAVTLLMFPVMMWGGAVLRRAAWSILALLWVLGAVYRYSRGEEPRVVSHD